MSFEMKKIVKFDGKIKNAYINEGKMFDSEGNEIDIIGLFGKYYGENIFSLSTTSKTEEILDDFEDGDSDDE